MPHQKKVDPQMEKVTNNPHWKKHNFKKEKAQDPRLFSVYRSHHASCIYIDGEATNFLLAIVKRIKSQEPIPIFFSSGYNISIRKSEFYYNFPQ
jgi:hypothetical protein